MATYVIEGKKITAPDDMKLEEVLNVYNSMNSNAGSSGFNPAKRESSGNFFGNIDPEDLKHDPDWVTASKILYKKDTGRDFKGNDAKAAEYGLDQMGWFNYNLPVMAIDAARIHSAAPDEKKAFLYLMDTYDDLQLSWGGVGRFIKGAATDPTNYIGLTTFGIGTAASAAEKVATKAGVKSLLRAGIDAGVMGAVQGGVSDAARQSVEMANDPNQEFSGGRLAGNAAFGAAAGAVLGAGIDAGATTLRGLRKGEVPVPKGEIPSAAVPEAPPAVEPRQLELGLEQPPITQQPALPGVLDVPQPAPNNEINSILDWKKRFTPEDRPVEPVVTTGEQGKLDLVQPKEGPYAYDGQGNLFEGLPRDKVGPELPEHLRGTTEKPVGGKVESAPTTPTGKANAAVPDAPLLGERLAGAVEHVQSIMKATDGDGANAIIKAIKDVVDPKNWSLGLNGRPAIDASIRDAVKMLNKLGVSSMEEAGRVFEAAGMSPTQALALKATINESADQAKQVLATLLAHQQSATGAAEKAQIAKLIEEYRPVQDMLAKLYLESSSGSGQTLALSKGNSLAGKNRAYASPDEILRRSNIDPANATPAQRQAADAEFLKQHLDKRNEYLTNEKVKDLDTRIERAKDNLDMKTANQLLEERAALIDQLAEADMVASGIEKSTARKINRMINEYVISTVFTPSTAIINTLPSLLKTLYKPVVNYLADPNSTVRGLTAQYAMMWNHIPTALRLAQASFAYEHAMLTGDVGKFLEQSPEFKGTFGRILRTFPRILQSTDEFFFALNYHGFVANEAMNKAIGEAERVGLKAGSKEYEKYLSDAVAKALKDAYTPDANATEVLSFLRQNGMDRGYTGEGLNKYMKTELAKNEKLFIEAANIEGKNYANDLLFRREFSGQGWESAAVKGYERFMNENALMRIGFQLFIRTPIRVFEEGIRLTPGMNLIAPRFLDDLRGLNGTVRQVRAKGEALMSMAFAGAVLSLYANNQISGAGYGDYKQARNKADAGDWKPYTLYFGEGKTLEFRNLDPFATPLKIMVNALDRLQMYQYRKAQGEYLLDKHNEVIALLAVGAGSFMQAVKDSGMTDGINQMSTFITDLSDMERKQDAVTKFLGQKLQLAVPNVIGKTETLFGGPVPMNEPANIGQMLTQRLNPYSDSLPRQRDALGYVREISNPKAAYFGIGMNNLMDRDIPQKAKEVLKVLSNIDTANDTSFVLPHTSNYFLGIDLRERYTPDGQTWADRIADIYNQGPVMNALHTALVKNEGRTTYSTPSIKGGTKLELAKSIISQQWEAATLKFIRENPEASALYKYTVNTHAQGTAGKFDLTPPR